MIENTASKEAPWYVVLPTTSGYPRCRRCSDDRGLSSLDLHYPKVSKEKFKELAPRKGL